jgi:RNA polymerase sigma factor (sigma-70 family)
MKLFPSRIAASHEELFVERYEQLLSWALQLSDQNRELAEDLLHDAFIQFSFTRPDLQTIRNLDAYFYGMLRNLHLSQVRRTTRSRLQQLSTVEYDSAEASLRATDVQGQIAVQDELRRVCHYACVRKEKTRAAGVLILRFFHGYYPSEIAQVLRNSRQAVDVHLLLARNEARAFLQNPETLAFMGEESVVGVFPTDFARTTDRFLTELRQMIFRSRRGDCLSIKQLRGLYRKSQPEPMNSKGLAHIVSCPNCLDEVNKLLGLPLISERYPADTIDKETPKRGGPGGGGAGGTMSGSMNRYKQRARNAFEHKPQELCVSVNGYIQGSQRISSEQSELNLTIDTTEKIGFVEVFSEQDVRLLLMSVDDLPPNGPAEQSLRVELSDGRALEVTLRFRSPWPTLHVVYHDPTFKEVEALLTELPVQEIEPGDVESGPREQGDGQIATPLRQPFARSLTRLWHRLSDLNVWLRPGTVTALLALVLIATVLFIELRLVPTSPANATTLLSQSVATEDLIAANVDQALHRTINLEERKSSGELIARNKIEVWQSAQRGITARRLFDEHEQLIAGDWRRSDGVQTLYHHGTQPKLQLAPEKREGSALSFDSVWMFSPSAKEFTQLIGNSQNATVEELAKTYRINYESGRVSGLIKATLVMNRDDLHAVEETLVVAVNGEQREYRFTEATFERHSLNTLTPSVFDPDPDLLNSSPTNKSAEPIKNESKTPENKSLAPVRAAATAELEVEVLRLLNRAGADMGEQVNVTRTPEGLLQVQGIVETDERKRELLRALDPVRNNPAVNVQINSVAEALQRQTKTAETSGPIVIERPSSATNATPVDAELQRYLAQKGESEEQAAARARRFTNRVVDQSSQVLQHAWAVKRLTERFSAEQLRQLSPEARANWLAMIREHCRALQQINAGLRQELQPIFFLTSPTDNAEQGIEIKDDVDLMRAAERLLGICTSNEKLISAAFTVSSGSSGASAIKSPQFARSLKSAEVLAARIARVQ